MTLESIFLISSATWEAARVFNQPEVVIEYNLQPVAYIKIEIPNSVSDHTLLYICQAALCKLVALKRLFINGEFIAKKIIS